MNYNFSHSLFTSPITVDPISPASAAGFLTSKPSVCNQRTRGRAGGDIWGSWDRFPSGRSDRMSIRGQFGSGASRGNRGTIQRGAVPFSRLLLFDRPPSHSQDSASREASMRKRLKARLIMLHITVCLKAYPDTNLEFFRTLQSRALQQRVFQ
jgi:hypothetical protein